MYQLSEELRREATEALLAMGYRPVIGEADRKRLDSQREQVKEIEQRLLAALSS